MSTEPLDLTLADLAQLHKALAGMREQYRRCYRAAEFAIRQSWAALRDAGATCRFHGDDLSASGIAFGRPRCESCRQPYAVTEALAAIDAWHKAEATTFTGGM